MKYLIFALSLLLCSCDKQQIPLPHQHDGHIYIWVPIVTKHGHFEHDPDCPKCRECQAALHQNEEI